MSKANRFRFRGRSLDGGEWVYGYLSSRDYIDTGVSEVRVDAGTVGRSTGLTDKHGREGFKGSVFKIRLGKHYWIYEVCDFPKITGSNLYAVCREHNMSRSDETGDFTYEAVRPKMAIRGCISKIKPGTIIGNIHENPELLVQP